MYILTSVTVCIGSVWIAMTLTRLIG
jgi:hypothetical protein